MPLPPWFGSTSSPAVIVGKDFGVVVVSGCSDIVAAIASYGMGMMMIVVLKIYCVANFS